MLYSRSPKRLTSPTPFEAPERIPDPDEREVADVELVVALGGREGCTTIKRSGDDLSVVTPTRRTVLRQGGARRIATVVLDQDLRLIEVGAEPERDRERHIAVGGALRRHVEHVLDAVDLLLDRRRDVSAMTSGGAPGYEACTTIVGGTTSGYWATAASVGQAPRMSVTIERTAAKIAGR